ncbi:MAG TPA: ATP-binding protein [Candidatus Goldiibacteriota bacterium]|nr:ATP-binding protein [Candidatus Goldiibacteriota bacterium]
MKNKLFYKIFLNYILILFFFIVIFVIISLNFSKKLYINSLEEILKDTSYLINENIKIYVKNEKFNEIDKIVKDISKDINVRITIIMHDGVVVADSDKKPSEMENHLTRPEIQESIKNGNGKFIRYSTTVKADMLYFSRKFHQEDKDLDYFIRTSFYLKNVNKGFADLRNKILLSAILIFLIFLIIIYFYSKKMYKPVGDLKIATAKIAHGDFEHKVILYQNDEFKDLADNFNVMADEIKKLFTQLQEKQEQLKIIIKSINEGILMIDDFGKIVFVNQKFNDVVSSECRESKFYWEFLLPHELIKMIERTRNDKTYTFESMEIKGRTLLCSVNYLKDYNKTMILLYDVSKVKELETLKKDLIANVSHEIKTPLTAIKGFTETAMEETKDKNVLHYLEIINGNAGRLINIVDDLLILSKLEQSGIKISVEEVNIREVLENVEKLFLKRIKEKKLKFNVIINDDVPKIKSDVFMLEQMFINLIDNATKYTEKGGIKVEVYIKDKSSVAIEVSDTGIGIPEEHIHRIFDRFYVVDKSRSKATGGTGLGLSIVKHIVTLLNGQITVQSKINEGTKFVIIFPV